MTPDHKSLSLYFVLSQNYQSEEDAAPDMQEAFKAADGWGLKPQWIKELDCLQTDSQIKGQVFIFENFVGDIFTRFTESHLNRVIGPKCLLTCFSKDIPIPQTKFPVFNMAMGGLIICASNIPVDQKKELKELVGYMGGNMFDPLTTSTTHLVVTSILSEKYFKACEVGVQIMRKSWIEDVWKKNLVSDVIATDENIIHDYKAPLFYNLKVTTSSLSEREKRKIKQIIHDNGGIYTQEMTKETDVLILPSGKGEKFKWAGRWKTKCLSPSWIECCLKKGYAVQYRDYIVHSAEKKCSTPVNSCNKMVSLMNANDSDISVISSGSVKTAICDTQVASLSTTRNNTFKTPDKRIPRNESSPKTGDSSNYQTILNDIVLTDVKKCGPLLDGCKMYLVGFKDNEEEKIRRILNYGGAIRFTELNESVTHVIVGNPNKHDLNNIKMAHHMPHIVTLDWLFSSIKKGCLEEESNCAYFLEDKKDEPQTSKVLQQPSPLSKKGLQMLKPTHNVSVNPEPQSEIDHNLIERYSHSSNPQIPLVPEVRAEESNHSDQGELAKDQSMQNLTDDKLFSGLKFAIIEHEPNERDYLKRTIVDLGGFVPEEQQKIDYAILPITNFFQDFRFTEVVSSAWIEECIRESRIVEIKYYHRPLTISEPLVEKSSPYVITFSSFSIQERQYLETVAEFLGARCQDVLSRKVDKDRNIAQTSHLVSALAQGAKYNAAKKWNLPIVTEKWLLDSFNQRKLLPIYSYLLREDEDSGSQPEEKKMNSRNDDSSSTKTSEKMTSNALRLYAIPTLAEAVENKSDNVCVDQNNRRKTEMKDFPLGLLAQINRASSSTIKRKVDDDSSNFEAARIGSPRRKLLRSDVGNVTSSYEEVGWQDTLTDVQLEDFPNPGKKENSAGAEALPGNDSNKGLPKNKLLNGNNEKDCNAELSSHIDARKNRVDVANNFSNCEINMLGVNEKEKERENKLINSRFQKNSRERTVQSKNDTKKTYWNMMISVNEKEKKLQCEIIINELGGKVITRFDPDCLEHERATHLIIDDLKKTEKLLCSISSGLWVLHSSYLLQCKKTGNFVDENQFEWGNPLSKTLPTKESNDYLWIAKAAHRWRKLIRAEGLCKRPFVGMKAVIISSGKDEAMQSLIRVVKSGGGLLLQSNEILKATHCFVTSVKNLDNLPVSMNELAAKKIHCLPAVYLSDYLMTDPPPEPVSCYFDAYKRLF